MKLWMITIECVYHLVRIVSGFNTINFRYKPVHVVMVRNEVRRQLSWTFLRKIFLNPMRWAPVCIRSKHVAATSLQFADGKAKALTMCKKVHAALPVNCSDFLHRVAPMKHDILQLGFFTSKDLDDQYLPHSLEVRLNVVLREGAELVHSDCYIIDVDGSRRLYDRRPISGYAYARLLRGEGPMFQGLLVSKKALIHINYLDENIVAFQEWETAIRLAKHYPFAYLPEPTFCWDCRNSDTMSKDLRRGGKGCEQVIHKHSLAIVRHAGPRVLAEHYRTAADWYRRGKDHESERRCVLMARAWSCLDPGIVLRKLRHVLNLVRG